MRFRYNVIMLTKLFFYRLCSIKNVMDIVSEKQKLEKASSYFMCVIVSFKFVKSVLSLTCCFLLYRCSKHKKNKTTSFLTHFVCSPALKVEDTTTPA